MTRSVVHGGGSRRGREVALVANPLGDHRARKVCLVPGPVTISPAVQAAWRMSPLYHREADFIGLFEKVRTQLGGLAGSRDVALFLGSGTLANEVVASTLAATENPGRGLILSNGAFGERLAVHAARFGLCPRVLTSPWGSPWDFEALAAALETEPSGSWVWGVHHESSTGVLNDLSALIHLARRRGLRVCADCVSSIGAVPLDLSAVYLASGTSGKALGSYSGVAIVFADTHALKNIDVRRVPSYLDLPATLAHQGPRFTFPAALIQALAAALSEYEPARRELRYAALADLGRYIRRELRRLGLPPMAQECDAGPTIATFTPPHEMTSTAFVELCRSWGFLVGGQSAYLAERCLVQIATMGAITRAACTPLFEKLERFVSPDIG
jgi:aspartate aminotransferase-like enzyme